MDALEQKSSLVTTLGKLYESNKEDFVKLKETLMRGDYQKAMADAKEISSQTLETLSNTNKDINITGIMPSDYLIEIIKEIDPTIDIQFEGELFLTYVDKNGERVRKPIDIEKLSHHVKNLRGMMMDNRPLPAPSVPVSKN